MEPNKSKQSGAARPDVRARAAQIERQLKSVPRPDAQPGPPDAAPRRQNRPARRDSVPWYEEVARAGTGSNRQERAARSAVPRAGEAPTPPNAPRRAETPPVRFDSVPRRAAPAAFDDFDLPDAPASVPSRARPDAPHRQARRPGARRRRRSMPSSVFFLLSAAFILTVSWGITALIELPERRAEAARLAAEAAETARPVAPEGEIGPVQSAGAACTPVSASVVAQPENGRVDMKYFDDALFIGDSLTRGFEEYASGIPNAHYAAYIGAGPRQFMEGLVQNRAGEQVAAIDEILAAAPRKVYILLGTNALPTLTDDAFLKYYGDFLDFLLPQLPADTVYYIQAIPPATAEKMDGDENFSRTRIQAINERLARLAFERGIAFLDLYSALADDTGALRADIASGDIHLNNAGYSLWREFLVTHAVYRKDNPYLPGSPCYTPAA